MRVGSVEIYKFHKILSDTSQFALPPPTPSPLLAPPKCPLSNPHFHVHFSQFGGISTGCEINVHFSRSSTFASPPELSKETSYRSYKELRPRVNNPEWQDHNGFQEQEQARDRVDTVHEEHYRRTFETTYRSICLIQTSSSSSKTMEGKFLYE